MYWQWFPEFPGCSPEGEQVAFSLMNLDHHSKRNSQQRECYIKSDKTNVAISLTRGLPMKKPEALLLCFNSCGELKSMVLCDMV